MPLAENSALLLAWLPLAQAVLPAYPELGGLDQCDHVLDTLKNSIIVTASFNTPVMRIAKGDPI